MGGIQLIEAIHASASGTLEKAGAAPMVSVIVPVFNNAGPLRDCLRALREQTLASGQYEIIVVDNGSTDDSAAVARQHPDVRVVSEPRPGSYAARNRGVALARGRLLAFTDSDCRPDRDWLAAGTSAASERPRLIVAGRVVIGCRDAARPTAVELYEAFTALDQRRFVEHGGFGATANLFVARDVFDRVGGFDPALRSGGDVEWCQRAVASGHTLRFAPDVRVSHPARRTLRELHEKVARTIGGAQALRGRARLLGIGRPAIADWIPPVRYAYTALRSPGLPRVRDKLRVAAVMLFVRYAEAFERLRLLTGGVPRR
ncbi:MAG TPA: glycosyltransferase [Vicinamibacterales bacterium]|nr:glycosyltransferase [Vicinamibacterales bacterium]